MFEQFEYVSASVIGRDHVLSGKGLRTTLVSGNNQDATFGRLASQRYIIGIIADGCGQGLHSEVGAKLGSVYMTERISAYLDTHRMDMFTDPSMRYSAERFLETIRLDMVAFAHQHAVTCHSPMWAFENYHRYSFLGVLVTFNGAMIFAIGDGVYAINGDVHSISFPDNKPPYFTYANTGSPVTNNNPELLKFQILERKPLDEVETLLIASDGLDWLITAGEHLELPGRSDTVGPVSQFWTNDEFFANAFAMQRRLKILNRDVTTIDWDKRKTSTVSGILRDDTTIVAIRRKQEAG